LPPGEINSDKKWISGKFFEALMGDQAWMLKISAFYNFFIDMAR